MSTRQQSEVATEVGPGGEVGRKMVKVSVEVRSGTARFRVGVQAESIRKALKVVEARYPTSEVRVIFPIDPEGFFVEGPPAARAGLTQPSERMAA
jgi:hypothetical protein